MPYVITTKRPGMGTSEGLSIKPGGFFSRLLASESRRAVATLEEAKAHAAAIVERAAEYDEDAFFATALFSESGETVGPLPDGTVIEVKRVEWHQLADDAGLGIPERMGADLIEAYNAREAVA